MVYIPICFTELQYCFYDIANYVKGKKTKYGTHKLHYSLPKSEEWSDKEKSMFIMSLMFFTPQPPIITYSFNYNSIVVSGAKMVNAIDWYFNQGGVLTDLEVFEKYNGLTKDTLPFHEQNRIYPTKMNVHILDLIKDSSKEKDSLIYVSSLYSDYLLKGEEVDKYFKMFHKQ